MAGEATWHRAGLDRSGKPAVVRACNQDLAVSWEAVVGLWWWVELEGHEEGSQIVVDMKGVTMGHKK